MAEAAKKDFNYYLSHPDDLPSDPDEIMRLAAEHADKAMRDPPPADVKTWSGGEAEVHPLMVDRTKDAPPEKPAAEPVKAQEPKPEVKQEAKPEGEPAGVLTKDGKNLIPYAVLEGARERASQLEKLVADQAAELQRLQRQPEKEEEPTKIEFLSDEDLAAVKEELPAIGAAIESTQRALKVAFAKLDQVSSGEPTQGDIESEMREAIDGNETLVRWEAAKPGSVDWHRWNKAAEFDEQLRADPQWSQKSFADRFTEAVKRTLELMPEPKAEPKAEDLSAAAAARLKDVDRPPISISQIPGGIAPAQTESQKLEGMKPAEIADMLMRQSGGDPEKMQQLLARM